MTWEGYIPIGIAVAGFIFTLVKTHRDKVAIEINTKRDLDDNRSQHLILSQELADAKSDLGQHIKRIDDRIDRRDRDTREDHDKLLVMGTKIDNAIKTLDRLSGE